MLVGPSGAKAKEKEKKDGPRQTTLLAMMPGHSLTNDQKPRNKRKSGPTVTQEPPAANDALLDSQTMDITMSDVMEPSDDAGTTAETQTDGWEETQIVDSSQALLEGSRCQPSESLTCDSQETQLV